MKVQARAYGICLGIHALVFSTLLALGVITPRTRAVVLNFSIDGFSEKGKQAVAPARHHVLVEDQRTVMPTARDGQAWPIRKDQADEAPQPISTQPVAEPENTGGADAAARSEYLSAQFVNIRNTIVRNLNYPAIARTRGWSGKVTVAFTVCADGSVEELSVLESSGFPVLDKSALETIRKACPLPKPPVKTALIMPVVYRLE